MAFRPRQQPRLPGRVSHVTAHDILRGDRRGGRPHAARRLVRIAAFPAGPGRTRSRRRLRRQARPRAARKPQDRNGAGAGAVRGARGERFARDLRLGGERGKPLPPSLVSPRQPRQGSFLAAGHPGRAAAPAACTGELLVRRRRRRHARPRRGEGGRVARLFSRQLFRAQARNEDYRQCRRQPQSYPRGRRARSSGAHQVDGARTAGHRADRVRGESRHRRLLARRCGLLGGRRRDPVPRGGNHHRRQPARHVPFGRGGRKRRAHARLAHHRLDSRRRNDHCRKLNSAPGNRSYNRPAFHPRRGSPMKRREFLKNAGLGAAAGAGLVTAAQARAQQTAGLPSIQWRLAASWPKSLDTLFGGADLVSKRVAEITDGKFQIRAFAAGEIVPALQVLDAVQAGTVELGHTATYYYFGKDPTFALGTAVCFGMNTRQQNAWWYFGGGSEAMAPLFKEYGCIALLSGNTGCQMGGWFRKEIKSVADLKGLKMRIGGMAGLVLAKLGVVPQLIGAPDIYPALEKGTIDAAEWVGPYDDEKLGFNKVAKNYYYPGFWEGGPMLMTLVNEKKWIELPKPYQAALTAACVETNSWMPAKYDEQNPQALRRLIASGTNLRPFPRAVLEAAEKASYELYDELKAKSKHWATVYPQWKKFRDEQFLWFRVAESTYDNYSVTSKLGAGKS